MSKEKSAQQALMARKPEDEKDPEKRKGVMGQMLEEMFYAIRYLKHVNTYQIEGVLTQPLTDARNEPISRTVPFRENEHAQHNDPCPELVALNEPLFLVIHDIPKKDEEYRSKYLAQLTEEQLKSLNLQVNNYPPFAGNGMSLETTVFEDELVQMKFELQILDHETGVGTSCFMSDYMITQNTAVWARFCLLHRSLISAVANQASEDQEDQSVLSKSNFFKKMIDRIFRNK